MSNWDTLKQWFGKKKAQTELEVEKKKNDLDDKRPVVVVDDGAIPHTK
jgi:hypothetical protein